jgi:hypothetical protein
VVDPVRRGAAGPECVLQAAVEVFYHPVRLRVVGSGLIVLNVEEAAEGGPHTVTRIDVIFRYPDRVPLTHFVHGAKKVLSM